MMAIAVQKVLGGFVAKITPPHSKKGEWRTVLPISKAELVNKAVELGVHQRDILDAIWEAE